MKIMAIDMQLATDIARSFEGMNTGFMVESREYVPLNFIATELFLCLLG